jgi:sensor histidine kinase YesM
MAIPCGILGQFFGSAILIQFHLIGLPRPMSPSATFLHKLTATWIYAPIFVLLTATFMLTIYGFELMKLRLEKTASALKEKELQEERLLKLKAEAELRALQARINPHFLFNTLNSIASLISEDPQKAEEMIEKLSALFRYTLIADRSERVPLVQELHILLSYIDIEKLRLGPRLRVSFDIEEDLRDLRIPPLLLQPIVENSIKYAVASREDGGGILVRIRRNGTRCRFQVIDDGPGFSREPQGTGYALENIRQRLVASYGNRQNFSIARDGGNTIVQFECPMAEANGAPVL